jgi:hypothetical protein
MTPYSEPGSDGQALSPFGTSGVDDGPAAAGLHADEKAMGARAADFGGLISAFHGWLSEARERQRRRVAGRRWLWALERATEDYNKKRPCRQPMTLARFASGRLQTGVFPCG